MPLNGGTRLGPYEILTPLGAGGMGEVYRGRDTRLDRIVAIKVLPAALATDRQFRERFVREAKTISALNDPNICALYDVGKADGETADTPATHFLVMEYFEGETLAARLSRGALPLAEGLRIASDIASALDTAHRHGIIHRDLKPGNVFLVRRGASSAAPGVKLLDFGLAKFAANEPGALVTAMPTVTTPITSRGTILGTFQYMAPEQIEGAEAGARTDIFAFGALLYEMFTGRPAFQGKSQASLFGAILKEDPPPLSQVQPVAPPDLDHLVGTCLAKDPDARFQSVHDVRLQLKWIADKGSEGIGPIAVGGTGRTSAWWLAAAVALATVTGAVVWRLKPTPPEQQGVVRFQYPLPEGQTFARSGRRALGISPDGMQVVYHADQYLYLRPMNRMEAEPIRGTNEDPMEPVFSPDSASLAYFAWGGRTLRKVAIPGGSPVTLAELPVAPNGASWSNGLIVFAMTNGASSGIFAVPEDGGEPKRLLSVDPNVERPSQPRILDDGKHVLFTVTPPTRSAAGEGTIVVQSLETGRRTIVVDGGTGAHVLPTGHLVYVHDGSLHGFPFNSRTLDFTPTPVLLVENVLGTGGGQFAVSSNGTLVYQSPPVASSRVLVWVDRQGREQPIAAEPASYLDPRISPDGTQLAVSSGADIWIWTFAKQALARLTFTKGPEFNPLWAPDGHHVIFDSNAGGTLQIVRKAVDGTGAPAVVVPAPGGYPETISPDGKFLVYHTASQLPNSQLLPLSPAGAATPITPAAKPPMRIFNAEISPDGKWIAYQSDESGRFEVCVRPFPEMEAGVWQISKSGGAYPLWARNGTELFFIDSAGTLMSSAVQLGQTFNYVTAVPLLAVGQYYVDVARDYDVAKDGSRFLFVKNVTSVGRPSVVVVDNWFKEVREKMRVR